MSLRLRGSLFTEPGPKSGLHYLVVPLLRACTACLPVRYLATLWPSTLQYIGTMNAVYSISKNDLIVLLLLLLQSYYNVIGYRSAHTKRYHLVNKSPRNIWTFGNNDLLGTVHTSALNSQDVSAKLIRSNDVPNNSVTSSIRYLQMRVLKFLYEQTLKR
jgi:hypothetical protein